MGNMFSGKSGKSKTFYVSNDLHFTIRYYNIYQAYDYIRYYKDEDYGEIGTGLVCGDRYSTKPMDEGFIYIFRTENRKIELISVYQVQKELYTQLKLADNHVNYKRKIGKSRKWMVIKKYFNDVKSTSFPNYYAIVSQIKLSNERLFTNDKIALTKNIDMLKLRGEDITIRRSNLTDVPQEKRSGFQIFSDWNKVNSEQKVVTLTAYNFFIDKIGGLDGFHLLIPNVADELRRRNNLFRMRLKKYHSWLNDEKRTQEAFIHQAVRSIIKQDKDKESYINKKYFKKWRDDNIEQYRKHFFPVHYAIENLIDWFKDDRTKELLRDYSFGDDDHQEEGLKLYHDGIRDIFYTEAGTEYLSKEYDDSNSYLAQSVRLLALKPEYADKNLFNNMFLEVRKWGNITFGFLEEIAPIIVGKEKGKAIAHIINIIKEKTGYVLERVRIKPSGLIQKSVEVIDVDKFLSKIGQVPDTKGGKAVISFIEIGNVALAVWGLAGSETGADVVKNSINIIGAGLDFSSSNWLIQGALKRKLGTLTGTKMINGMILISGIIDCLLGIWEAKKAWQEGEIDVAIGWSIFALGGAIIAFGAGMKIWGAKVAVGSGGTLAKPGIVLVFVGLLVEGIGLAVVFFCNNDEIEDWLTQCKFGEKPKGKSLLEQIQDLNDIMCKFEVDAKFEETTMKFYNLTAVTFVIKPRVINDNSRITFSNLKASAYARFTEYFFGNRHDIITGFAGSPNPILDLSNPTNCTIYKENGRITRIETILYYKMDIDEVSGEITLDVNNGTLQGYQREFEVKA